MNICIITSWFPSTKRPYVGSFVYNFAKSLGKSGMAVSVISPLGEGDESITQQDSITIYRIRGKFPIFSMLRLVNQIKPYVIHVHAPNFFSSCAILAGKLNNIPIIATVHRAEIDAIGKPISLVRKYVLARFQKIIAVSDFTRSLALKAGVHENKISVIYNSCDETVFYRKDKFVARKRCNLPFDKKIILFVGNLIKIKGVYTLIESLRTLCTVLPDLLVLVIGRGEERENLESLVNEYGLTGNVKFLGWLPQTQLSDFYNAADVLVLPSVVEGHSVAVLEAMASGLPVVASSAGGNKESIEDGVNGFLFESGDQQMLAEKLALILNDWKLQERLSINASNIYLEKFSMQNQIENHLKLYRSLIDKRAATENPSTVLLIDNQGLSHYTSYLACGISRYRDIILYGFSKDDYISTGAKEKGVNFFDIREKLPKGTSLILRIVGQLLLFFPLFRALTKTTYDVVHIQGHLPMFFLFIPMLKLKGKQICWTLHDVNLRPSSNGIRGKLELLYMKAITQPRILSRYADAIIVHGSLLKNQLAAIGVNRNKIHVMPHFDYRYLNPNGITNSTDYVLLFGRIKPYKGIDVLIEAAKIVRKRIGKKINILIAGKGDASYFESLLAKEDRQYIHIRNEFIPYSEVPDIFTKAKFVVLPYTDGSQSGVIPLAYTFSKPVIVSNVGSIAEYVEHGETGFIFETGNSRQLADYMIELVEDDRKCLEMGKNAYQKLLQDMSLESCCKVINDIYKRNS